MIIKLPGTNRQGTAPGGTNMLPGIGVANFTTETPGGNSAMRWTSMLLAGVVGTVIAAAAVVTVLTLTGNDKLDALISAAMVHPHESTAEWVSDDAVGYASINLRPGLSELLKARSFFENVVDFEQAELELDDAIEELNDFLGTDVRDGVLPVLGPELAVAAYTGNDPFAVRDPFSSSVPFRRSGTVFFVGFIDMDVGRSLVDAYVARVQERGEYLDTFEVDGLTTHEVEGGMFITVHDSEPYVLLTTDVETLEHTLSMMREPVNPLADDADFIAVMERLPDKRFLSGYANFESVFEDLSGVEFFPLTDPFSQSAGGSPIIAGAITVGKKDLRMDYVSAIDVDTYSAMTVPSDSMELIPGDLIGFFNMGGLSTLIDQGMAMLSEDGIDQELRDSFAEATGLDLDTDLLDAIGDEFAIALIDLESADRENPDFFEDFPNISAVLLVETTDPARMESTMDRMRELALDADLVFTEMDIAGARAWSAPIPDGSLPFELAYMISDGFFVGSISTESLELVKKAADGDIASVDDNDAYKHVVDIVGDNAIMTIFVESESLSRSVRTFISPEDLPEFDERFVPWFEKIEAFALTVDFDGSWTVTTGILTLN